MEKEIIYYRETNWQSIVADTYMLLSLVGAMAINHYYLGDSSAWAVLLFLLVMISILGRGLSKRQRFESRADIIEHLETNNK